MFAIRTFFGTQWRFSHIISGIIHFLLLLAGFIAVMLPAVQSHPIILIIPLNISLLIVCLTSEVKQKKNNMKGINLINE